MKHIETRKPPNRYKSLALESQRSSRHHRRDFEKIDKKDGFVGSSVKEDANFMKMSDATIKTAKVTHEFHQKICMRGNENPSTFTWKARKNTVPN